MTTLILASASAPEPPRSSKELTRANQKALMAAELRATQMNVDAALTENHMYNTTGLYNLGLALAGDDPGLQRLLGSQVQQYAARRA